MKRSTVSDFLKENGIAPVRPGKIIGKRVGGDPEDEREHFYLCPSCGQAVDARFGPSIPPRDTPS
jgi:hypothetical protein